MAFKKHSASTWLARSSITARQLNDDPDNLYKAVIEYFEWAENNPIYEDRVTFCFGVASHEAVAHPRAMTLSGLSTFLGITLKTWVEWRKRESVKSVVEWAEGVIWEQKLTAAAAGMLDGRIIARELGLADKQIQEMVVPKMVIAPPEGERPNPPPPIVGETDE